MIRSTKDGLSRGVARALVSVIGSALCILAAPSPTLASQIEDTTVTAVGVGAGYDGLCGFECMLLALASMPTGSSCLMDSGWAYAIDISTTKGRVMAAAVLAAKTSGAEVQVIGLNTCVFNNRVERISIFVTR